MMLSAFGDKSDLCCSSSASNLPLSDKKKDIVRPPNTTSLRSLAELLSFKSLISSSTKSIHQNLLPHDDALVAPRRAPSSSSSPFSATVISNNEDLLIQILLFLPPKSLIRFQCISKQWRALISSPRFCRLHLQKSRTTSSSASEAGLFLYRRIYKNFELNAISLCHDRSTAMGMISSRFVNFLGMEGEILGFHSCNGLIFIDFWWNYDIRRYYVYNPTTNQYRLIPQPDIDGKFRTTTAVNIVFDPLMSDEYRLVCVLSKVIDEEMEIGEFYFLVYSSETAVWKECTDVKTEGTDYYHFKQGVYWNGNLYWNNAISSLLCFDFEHNCVRKMKMTRTPSPRPPPPYLINYYFGESGGNLHLIHQFEPQPNFFHIRELELELGLGRYNSRWLLKYRVDIGALTARYPLLVNERFAAYGNQFVFGIPYFLVDKKENKAKVMISLRGKIILHEIISGSIEELVEIEPANLQFLGYHMSFYDWNAAFKHFETLACV
ncbi:F-box protein At5g07610-like [Coffea arabica]|uniref:F-box protein At5g07610-like n=1 Tax=Coffea arabica TaxID=13443 RepID=A0A6P6SPF1_COFAR|nr:F-box protein At5g07610-like [Coffea arabica]